MVTPSMALEAVIHRFTDIYGRMRGWEYGGTEWKRRLNVVHCLRPKAMDMEREGMQSDAIFDFLRQGLLDEGISSNITENFTHPLADPERHKFPRAIIAAQPGEDDKKPLTGGWIVYTEGDAKAADNPQSSSKVPKTIQ